MTDPLIPLEEPEGKPLTTWRVVIIAAFVALVIGCLPALTTALVVGDNISTTQDQIIQGRINTTRTICDSINEVVKSDGELSDYLGGLIIDGAKSSKVFEKLYRDAGAPPYEQRVTEARKTAKGLRDRKPHVLDCNELIRHVSEQK